MVSVGLCSIAYSLYGQGMQAGMHVDRQAGRQVGRQVGRQGCRQAGSLAGRLVYLQTPEQVPLQQSVSRAQTCPLGVLPKQPVSHRQQARQDLLRV
jgi:hypothetical protein